MSLSVCLCMCMDPCISLKIRRHLDEGSPSSPPSPFASSYLSISARACGSLPVRPAPLVDPPVRGSGLGLGSRSDFIMYMYEFEYVYVLMCVQCGICAYVW